MKSSPKTLIAVCVFDLITDFATDKLSVGVIDDTSRESGFTRIDLPRTATN